MRKETNMVKQILCQQFLHSKFKFKFCAAPNYIDSSDCIKIKCENEEDVEEVIKFLKKNTRGIAVYQKGKMESIFHRQIASQFIHNNQWVDFGLVEFIEVS